MLLTADFPGWPYQGESAMSEVVRTHKLVELGWNTHHTDIVNKSAFPKSSGVARAHRRTSEALVFPQHHCQEDITTSACGESLVRYSSAIESAARRNP